MGHTAIHFGKQLIFNATIKPGEKMILKRRPLSFAACFAIFLFCASCNSKKPEVQQQVSPPPIVDVIIAQTKGISNIIEANGAIVAGEYVELHPETNGRIVYLDVPEGRYTEQGTVIARIYDLDLQAQLSRAKAQFDLAQKTEERLQKLLDVNGVNQADYDAAVNDVTINKSEVNRLNALINKTVVKAPFSGVVGLRKLSMGAYVTSADIITTIQQVNKLKVDFTVPEVYSSIIKKGGIVEVEISSGKQRHKAVIIATEPQINAETRNLLVRALLQDGTASPGSFVKVYVNAGTDKTSIMVPANAIIPDAKSKKLVIIKDGKAKFTNVETGTRLAGEVEVTSGITAGDSVAVTGVLFARPDKPVKIRSVKQLKDLAQ